MLMMGGISAQILKVVSMITLVFFLTVLPPYSFAQYSLTDSGSSLPQNQVNIPPHKMDSLELFIDGVVEQYMKKYNIPGAVVSIASPDSLLFSKGYGVENIEDQTPLSPENTLVQIGSVSKLFVWVGAMILYDRGLLDLDMDINEYLKEYKVPDGPGGPVTMRHLMHHRAGFGDPFLVFTHRNDPPIPMAVALKRDEPYRAYAPGERTSYSNWGTTLAAQVVEDIAGMPFADFFEREFTQPLQMNSTTIRQGKAFPAHLLERVATPHTFKKDTPKVTNYMEIGPHAPSGGIHSTANDMAQLLKFYLNNGVVDGHAILSAATFAKMRTREYTDRTGAPDVVYGIVEGELLSEKLLYHSGGTKGFITSFTILPDRNIGIFVNTNSQPPRSLSGALPDTLVKWINNIHVAEIPEAESADGYISQFEGHFLNNRRDYKRFERALFIMPNNYVSVKPLTDNSIEVSIGNNPLTYYLKDSEKDQFINERGSIIDFGRTDGKVSHVMSPFGVLSYEKINFWDRFETILYAMIATTLLAFIVLIGSFFRFRKNIPAYIKFGAPVLSLMVIIVPVSMGIIAITALEIVQLAAMYEWPFIPAHTKRIAAHFVVLGGIISPFLAGKIWKTPDLSAFTRTLLILFSISTLVLSILMIRWSYILTPMG